MTDLTIRQILDAMTRALDETARHFAKQKSKRAREHPQLRSELEDAADQNYDSGRAS
ncbi:MAG: hypothetical protein JO328_06160 [Hyphomicrobiales bacterium]|nr:hypothetical protein [Hyphomicrobiales bacterium]MBV8825419.1 hypothetical protein [Hyphomicrobiales bacterium]